MSRSQSRAGLEGLYRHPMLAKGQSQDNANVVMPLHHRQGIGSTSIRRYFAGAVTVTGLPTGQPQD